MNIYSTKVCPYVYRLTHKLTGEYYIGSRYTKKLNLPPEEDIVLYQSSSKTIHISGFDNFNYEIIALFFAESARQDSYQFENNLIKENWGDPLLLNKHYSVNGHEKFVSSHTGMSGKVNARLASTGENINAVLLSDPRWQTGEIVSILKGVKKSTTERMKKPKTEAHKKNLALAATGRSQSYETIQKRVSKTTGKKRTDDFKLEQSIRLRGKQQLTGKGWWTNGLIDTRSVDSPGEGWVRGRCQLHRS
jgi:hypothetical protein